MRSTLLNRLRNEQHAADIFRIEAGTSTRRGVRKPNGVFSNRPWTGPKTWPHWNVNDNMVGVRAMTVRRSARFIRRPFSERTPSRLFRTRRRPCGVRSEGEHTRCARVPARKKFVLFRTEGRLAKTFVGQSNLHHTHKSAATAHAPV